MSESTSKENRIVGVDILCEFLEIMIHSVLHVREIYPAGAFERSKKYGVPIQVCCHPDVKSYISDMLLSLKSLLLLGNVEAVSIVILNRERQPQERFTLEIGPGLTASIADEDRLLMQLEQSLRSCILKLYTCDAVLQSCPRDCSWTLHVHTQQSDMVDLQEAQTLEGFTWINPDKHETQLPDPQLIPLKAVQSPVIKLQMFVEESSMKGT